MKRSRGAHRKPCSKRIMIVEDEAVLAENIGCYLGAGGAQVLIAHSGEKALAESDSFAPQCLIVDYNLPGINGIETARRIRERYPDIHCVLITARPPEAVLAAARSHGIEDVLIKPFRLSQICSSCAANLPPGP